MKDLRKMLQEKEVSIGPFMVTASPAHTEAIGYAGFDFVIIDCEHAALSPYGTQLEECIRAACVADIVPIVRVTENEKGMILKALNLGGRGIIVPHINTKQDAEKMIRAARFYPEGRRSSAPPVRAAKYGFVPFATFWRQQNEQILTIPIIEEKEAAQENLSRILEVKGIDVVFFGPFDLSMTLGLDGVCNHPVIWDLLEKTVKLCSDKGVPVMNLAWDIDSAKKSIEMGCQMVALDVDMVIFKRGLQDLMQKVETKLRKQ